MPIVNYLDAGRLREPFDSVHWAKKGEVYYNTDEVKLPGTITDPAILLPKFYREVGKGHRLSKLASKPYSGADLLDAVEQVMSNDTVIPLPNHVRPLIRPILLRKLSENQRELFEVASDAGKQTVFVPNGISDLARIYMFTRDSQSTFVGDYKDNATPLFGTLQNSLDVLERESQLKLVDRISKIIEKKSHAVVMDLGCGGGLALFQLKKLFGDKITTIGVALTEEPRLPMDIFLNRSFEFLPASLRDSVDIAFSFFGLDYSVLPDLAVASALRTLTSDGILCVYRESAHPAAYLPNHREDLIRLYIEHFSWLKERANPYRFEWIDRCVKYLSRDNSKEYLDHNLGFCANGFLDCLIERDQILTEEMPTSYRSCCRDIDGAGRWIILRNRNLNKD